MQGGEDNLLLEELPLAGVGFLSRDRALMEKENLGGKWQEDCITEELKGALCCRKSLAACSVFCSRIILTSAKEMG